MSVPFGERFGVWSGTAPVVRGAAPDRVRDGWRSAVLVLAAVASCAVAVAGVAARDDAQVLDDDVHAGSPPFPLGYARSVTSWSAALRAGSTKGCASARRWAMRRMLQITHSRAIRPE